MNTQEVGTEDLFLSAAAYLLFVPSLYIVLSRKRGDRFNARHAAQALLLWSFYALLFVLMRTLSSVVIYSFGYFPALDHAARGMYALMIAYALYCAFTASREREVRIPLISALAGRIA